MGNAQDLRSLKRIRELGRAIETQGEDLLTGKLSETDLAEIIALCSQLEKHPHLHRIKDHLHSKMGLPAFVTFMVPIERALNQALTDSDLFITHKDRPQAIPALKIPLEFALENMRSGFNVGGIFRLGDAVGASQIHLCGYSPTPDQDAVRKTALKSEEHLPWKVYPRTEDCLEAAKVRGLRVVALETAHNAKTLYEPFRFHPTLLVVGNERFGLDPYLLNLCDEVRMIPMHGMKNSLNVVSSLSVAAFEFRRQWESNS
ncbi:MAG: TrmH family RNA methyltransferase [Proteobacteria bacterium]|jgi:tRNA G18 (ribose-2'-O)-methylase SpoU|nr:TrmH family RNA methyltransferase [Pseudomonadota bacterium]